MKNNYQEFFLSSNPKEIEQAKKKRSALISLFPKRLGEKDEYYIDEFQEYYTPSNSYQTPTVNKFNYNWIKLFDLFGIKYK